jgi:hypothetical protein
VRVNTSHQPDRKPPLPEHERYITFTYGWKDAGRLKEELLDPISTDPVVTAEMVIQLERFLS